MKPGPNSPDLRSLSPICESIGKESPDFGAAEHGGKNEDSFVLLSPPFWPFSSPPPEVSPIGSDDSVYCPPIPDWLLEEMTSVEETPGIWDLEGARVPGRGDYKAGSGECGGWRGKPFTGCDEIMLRILLPIYFELW